MADQMAQQTPNGGQSSSGNFAVTAPSISLPKGGGAIRSIGEKFSANPVTGTGSMTVPIATSPGRSGFGPELSLSYDSGVGNGPFGLGWSLSLPAITRKTDKGLPKYDDASESDVYVLSGAEDLVPLLIEDSNTSTWKRHKEARTVHGVDFIVERYRPRVEGLFARIERWTQRETGEIQWRSISRENITTVYGESNNSRIIDPDSPDPQHPTRIFSWLICESHDDKGNAIVYQYAAEDDSGIDLSQANETNRTSQARATNRYIKRIKYGNRSPNRNSDWVVTDSTQLSDWMFEVVFDYGDGHCDEVPLDPTLTDAEQHRFVTATLHPTGAWPTRQDAFSSFRAAFEVRTYRLCRRILMFHHFPQEVGMDDCLVGSTDVEYDERPIATVIRSIRRSGYVSKPNSQVANLYLHGLMPPVEFEYSPAPTAATLVQQPIREVDLGSHANLPEGLDGVRYQWIDLDGDGCGGIVTEQGGEWYFKRNLSPNNFPNGAHEPAEARLGPLEVLSLHPTLALIGGGRFLDLAGDGHLDLVQMAGTAPGFFERTSTPDEDGWAPFRSFTSWPNVDIDDSNLRFVDLTGDGHADILITEDQVWVWYASLAEEGYAAGGLVVQALEEEHGPRLVFADGLESIQLADLSGDGLTDLVRIRNGEVCYWPNLGYGRFGRKVTMDACPTFDPPDQYDARRIQLIDVDGSGVTDILYVGSDGARIYLNESGNRWGTASPLTQLPRIDDLTSLQALDLLGNGTACLVWASPLLSAAQVPLRYVDLMGGTKPHLLVKVANNLGAESQITYSSSTKSYLADRENGRPWVTRLPFPVHVVESVVTRDRISGNEFVTSYAYHHGYFDGFEREFRGFGMVEQWDTEALAALSTRGQAVSNMEASFHVPPVLTKTWFHTGAYLGHGAVSNFFAGLLDANDVGEYYREPGLTDGEARARLLEDTVLPDDLTVGEEREACRALNGNMLRQEVYALDGTDKEKQPYSVTEQNVSIRVLQPREGNRHAVFLAHARESINHYYERDPTDPRIGHALTLDVDVFGNVLQSAAIGYGRSRPDTDLSPVDQAGQTRTLVTYTHNHVTNSIEAADDYRTSLPCESLTYELTGLTLSANSHRFTFDQILDASTTATALEYEEDPTAGLVQKRLIEHVRTYYRRNDLAGLLPLAVLQSLALPFENYKLAFTPGLAAELLGGRASDSMVENGGRYVHLQGDANWWVPSGQIFYSPNPSDTPPEELAFSRRHFFLSHRYRDPFHTDAVSTESFIAYDSHDLLVQETRDALGNRVTVGERNRDPTQPPVRLGQDYRVLQPSLVMDPNRNCTEVAFDSLGMVVGKAVMGKPEEVPVPGDRLAATFRPDLTQAEIEQFLTNPKGPMAAALLDDATTRIIYDVTAYFREPDPTKKPPGVAASLARELHASEQARPDDSRIQIRLTYSDGFGREIQQKLQAESGLVPRRDGSGRIIVSANGQMQMTANGISPRWVGSGWTVFNNKGKPVRQYEPFFTDSHHFEFDVRIGVSPVLFYDPLGRVVATLHPNHTWEKMVFGPWRQETWDVNDTVLIADPRSDDDVGAFFSRLAHSDYLPSWHALRTDPAHSLEADQHWPDPPTRDAEKRSAEKASMHAATPIVAHADSLGRTFLTIAHNRLKYSDTPPADSPIEEFHRTRTTLDVEGNQCEVFDANDRLVMRYDHDMLANVVYQASMEAGDRWMLNDVAGNPIYAWDGREHRFQITYDSLRRPVGSFLRDRTGIEMMFSRSVYGETQPNPEASNLRGKVVHQFDQAGVTTSKEYDFKGNVLHSQRQLAEEYKATLDWSGAVTRQVEVYNSQTRYDALNRPTQLIAPHSDQPGATVNIVQPTYNEANLLEQLCAWLNQNAEPAGLLDPATANLRAVTDIDYDATGQRKRITYGNGAITFYDYDPLTFRLLNLLTQRNSAGFPDDCSDPSLADWPGCQVQNLHYSYDPAGNITHIRDEANQVVYFRNRRVNPNADYTYDAIYRLIEATGREHLEQVGGSPIPHSHNDALRIDVLHPGDSNAMGRYCERYGYDMVGNLLLMQHRGSDPAHSGWSRIYTYSEPSHLEPGNLSNRLTSTAIGQITETYSTISDGYDAHGNMLRLPHLQVIDWDFKDQLHMTQRQAVNAGKAEGVEQDGERTWYVYDIAGQRVRKVTETASGQVKEERVYLGGFEIYRKIGANPLVLETLHILDETRPLALVETRMKDDHHGPEHVVRYQFGNHLGSSSLELDGQARIISYEEYTPYGSTSFEMVASQTETPKRYRHTGKERDTESGFCYHGIRYYAPWLARWTICDPAGLDDGPNLYRYCNANPVNRIDTSGADSEWCVFCNPFSDDVEFAPLEAVEALGANAVEGSRTITEGISRGTSAAGDWVSDRANDLSSELDESGHPWLAGATRGAGIFAATATKTIGEVAGQTLAVGPNIVLALDSGGKSIGTGAARIATAEDWKDATLGGLEILAGAGEGAQVVLQTTSATRSWGSGTIKKAGQSSTVRENKAHGDLFRDKTVDARSTPWRASVNEVTIRPNAGPGKPGTKADNFRIDTLEQSKITGQYKLVEAKGTSTARLTKKQIPGFERFKKYGGQVVGKAGGSVAPPGTILPPSGVALYRPLRLFLETFAPPSLLNAAQNRTRTDTQRR